jgi:hypothetical protein
MVAEATGEDKRDKDRINPTSVRLKDNKDLSHGFISGIHHDARRSCIAQLPKCGMRDFIFICRSIYMLKHNFEY